MEVKEAGLSPEVVKYLSELSKYNAAQSHGEIQDYYIVIPYKEIRRDGSESKEFLFYAGVSKASLEEAKNAAQSLLEKSCVSHKMDGHIQGWRVNHSKVREASPRERKLCTDYSLADKV